MEINIFCVNKAKTDQMSVWCWPTDWPRGPGRGGGEEAWPVSRPGKYLPSFFSESSYTHTHLSPTHSHSYTRCIHSRWVTHHIDIGNDSPTFQEGLCRQFAVRFMCFHSFTRLLVSSRKVFFISVVDPPWFQNGSGSNPDQDPVPVRIQFWSGSSSCLDLEW